MDLVTAIHGLLDHGASIDTSLVCTSEIDQREYLTGMDDLCMKTTHEMVRDANMVGWIPSDGRFPFSQKMPLFAPLGQNHR
jgi:hypothetical protein